MMHISDAEFEKLVWAAFDALPEQIRSKIQNCEIEVKAQPDPYELDMAGEDDPTVLFGFYDGTPLPERAFGYDMTVPDVIYIYRRAHEIECDTPAQIRDEVTRTLKHELAHHFGIDDDRLDELDAY
jgi:predicted Zn-dependent protease with MMP-like domain